MWDGSPEPSGRLRRAVPRHHLPCRGNMRGKGPAWEPLSLPSCSGRSMSSRPTQTATRSPPGIPARLPFRASPTASTTGSGGTGWRSRPFFIRRAILRSGSPGRSGLCPEPAGRSRLDTGSASAHSFQGRAPLPERRARVTGYLARRCFSPLLTSCPATGEWSTTSRECGAMASGVSP